MFMGDDLHYSRMELVLVTHRCGTTLQVADVGFIVGHDQRALELTGIGRIDAEIGAQLHRATHPFGDIDERAIREDRRVQSREEIIPIAHDTPQIFLYQIRMMLHRLTERTEDNAFLRQVLLERGLYRDTIHDRIHRHSAQVLLLLQGNAQLIEGLQQLRIHLVEALRSLLPFRSGIIDDVLIVDGRNLQVCPMRHL